MSVRITGTPVVDAQHPWLGLLPYKEEHREFFFGRDREVEDILGRIRDNSLTILYGQSGLGKSSLLAAGVVPRLREAGYAPRWVRLGFEEGQRFQTLVQQTHVLISAAHGSLTVRDFGNESPLQRFTLWERFHHRSAPTAPIPVLVFDQFEEIFTLGAQPQFEAEVAEWLEQMADLLQSRPPRHLAEAFASDRDLAAQYHFGDAPVRIVFTLREDYLAQLERWKPTLPLLMQNRMALSLLSGPQARQAVLGPAQLGDHSLVSREVAEMIVRTVARVPGDTPLDQIKAVPPLLSLLCEQLNAARLQPPSRLVRQNEGDGADPLPTPPHSGECAHSPTQITAAMVREQSDDILQRFYEDSFLTFPHEHRARIRALLEDPPMITEAGYRNALVRADAEAQLARAGVADARAIFDTLIQRRLITAETRDQVQRLEITHDVLVPLLLRSRKERQDREAKEQAQRAAAAAQAEQERLAKERRRLRLGIIAITGLALLALAAASYGWWQANAARIAEGKALQAEADATVQANSAKRAETLARSAETQAQDQIAEASRKAWGTARDHFQKGDARTAFAFLAEAIRYDSHLPKSRRNQPLHNDTSITTLRAEQPPIPLGEAMRHKETVWSASFSLDGQRVVTASWDNTAQMWDAATGQPLGEPMRHEEAVNSASFSPDGQRVVTASSDKTVRLWDAATGKPLGRPMRHEETVRSASLSPDGQRVVTASDDKTARLWDAATGQPLGEPMRHEETVRRASFSPDGQRVVAASSDNAARLWDAATGKPLGVASEQDQQMAFNRDLAAPSATLETTGSLVKVGDGAPANSQAIESDVIAFAGRFINVEGQANDLPLDECQRWRKTVLATAGSTPWQRLLHWKLSDPRTRTITLRSRTTAPEHIEREVTWAASHLSWFEEKDPFSAQNLDRAMLTDLLALDPGAPLVHLALAAIEDNPQSRAFLIAYGLKRLAVTESTLGPKAQAAYQPHPGTYRAKAAIILWLMDEKVRAKEIFARLIQNHDPKHETWAEPVWVNQLPDFEWPKVFRETLIELAK